MPETTFEFATPTGTKVKCTVCGRTGWGLRKPTRRNAVPWQLACLDGHPFECSCGKRYATPSAIAGHRRATKHPRKEDDDGVA